MREIILSGMMLLGILSLAIDLYAIKKERGRNAISYAFDITSSACLFLMSYHLLGYDAVGFLLLGKAIVAVSLFLYVLRKAFYCISELSYE